MATTFYLKRPKSSIPTSIYARFIYSGRQVKIYLKESLNPKVWDSENQRVRKTRDFPEHVEINALLNNIRTQFDSIYRNLRTDLGSRLPDPKELKKAFDRHIGSSRTISEKDPTLSLSGYFSYFIHLSENGNRSVVVRSGTLQVYRKALDHLRNFESKTHHQFGLDEINQDFYTSFLDYLRNDRNLADNTIGKQVKTIKTVMRHALEAKKHTNRDFEFKSFKALKEDAESIYLSVEELEKIENLDLSQHPILDRVRDAFLIGCYTGLRYSDYSDLKIENIINGNIEKEQAKTGKKVIVPIHAVVNRILIKYQGSPPPRVSNQRSNKYVKEVCLLIPELNNEVEIRQQINGVSTLTKVPKYKLVSTHTARRSFATNSYKAGIPSITIMAITGHKTEKVFLNYIKIKQDEHARILKGIWDRVNSTKI